MKVLFLTEGPTIPASRFRVEQFLPALEARGLQCTVGYAYGHGYNDVLSKPWANAYKLACRLRRAAVTAIGPDYDLIFLQRTALPMSALPERLRALRNAPMVFDFDDAIYLGPGGIPSTSRAKAFHAAIRASKHVIAGNSHLAAQAGVPHKTTVIPTVVDTTFYVPPPVNRAENALVIGWMGTASNFDSLRTVLPQVLSAIRALPHATLRIVSNAELPELRNESQVEQVRWTARSEVKLLQSFDIGLMPLADTPLNWGKCGFKMIQYMAVGATILASDVGANRDIFEGSAAGQLIAPGGDWIGPLRALAGNVEARMLAGASGRRHVVARYAVDRVVDQLVGIFRAAVDR